MYPTYSGLVVIKSGVTEMKVAVPVLNWASNAKPPSQQAQIF